MIVWLVLVLVFGGSAGAADRAGSSELVRIPSGSFWMGSDEGSRDERPRHRVTLEEFWIDRIPVTNARFSEFMNSAAFAAGGRSWYDVGDNDARIHRRGEKWQADPGFADHPAVEVSWYGADAFCRWAGGRLPTEAEWEKAARGTDGRKYPWGMEAPDKSRAQFGAGWNETRPAGSFPKGASPYGVLDMAGNVWQWVSSIYAPYPYDAADGREDPRREAVRGTRGGGHDSPAGELTATQRGASLSRNPRSGHHNIGFRCARSTPPR
ncbi:MAG TPA: SUMF1/EgtB/PvdO family nonheme iron enzyme [candidate division Zixibacteria bacterium]|nr:SUMF1/EgtB/PvdO family nonheme iron enzyme [candidate division Zixibacteria bacterium]